MAKAKKKGADLGALYRPTAAEAVGAVNGAEGGPAPRRKPGPKPDPSRRELRAYLYRLKPEHADALRRAAAARVGKGISERLDASEVLRLLLDGWIAKGAKAP